MGLDDGAAVFGHKLSGGGALVSVPDYGERQGRRRRYIGFGTRSVPVEGCPADYGELGFGLDRGHWARRCTG